MKGLDSIVLGAAFLLGCGIQAVRGESIGTAFTYQGQIKESSVPLNGMVDLRFSLWDAETNGNQVGSTYDPPPVSVTDGLFMVEVDFGSEAFGPDARWLELAVRSGADDYTTLSPRQAVTATPVALYALNGPGGTGYWIASGDNIHNSNTSGNVGVGTPAPIYNLHIYGHGGISGSASPATLGVQRFLGALPPGVGLNDWFSIEVGGSGVLGGAGTRLIREAGTMLSFQTEETIDSNPRTTQMVLDADGNVGLGTTEPDSKLHVIASGGQTGIHGSSGGIGVYGLHSSTGGTFPGVWGDTNSLSSGAAGVRGIVTATSPGSGSAGVLGYNKSTTLNGYGVRGVHDGFGSGVYGISENGIGVQGVSENGIGVYGKTTNGTYAGWFDGRIRTEVLEITGADLAEMFPMSETAQPGMVVAIDPKHPGKLCLSRQAYNRCVAGVVSGANGLQAGAILGHLPGSGNAPPIALSGRVWVHCDATNQRIVPGDLLTTSDVAGHAMKVTDYGRGQGAIIGKAMTGLDGGRGMVLVLVSLQ